MQITSILRAAACAAAVAMPGAALADWQPDGPITLQVGFGAGGSTDTLARAIAAKMEENTGWNVIVENRPGGGGIAMFSTLVNAEADGQLIGMGVTIPTLINLAERGDTLPIAADVIPVPRFGLPWIVDLSQVGPRGPGIPSRFNMSAILLEDIPSR
jgi:tripartite-type tricarboxylate transporter receptor subunit TctC